MVLRRRLLPELPGRNRYSAPMNNGVNSGMYLTCASGHSRSFGPILAECPVFGLKQGTIGLVEWRPLHKQDAQENQNHLARRIDFSQKRPLLFCRCYCRMHRRFLATQGCETAGRTA